MKYNRKKTTVKLFQTRATLTALGLVSIAITGCQSPQQSTDSKPAPVSQMDVTQLNVDMGADIASASASLPTQLIPPTVVSTPTDTPTPTTTFTPWPTATPWPTSTPWPTLASFAPVKHPPFPTLAPILVTATPTPGGIVPNNYSPPDGVDVFGSSVFLRWRYHDELAEDEFYDIRVRPLGSDVSVYVDWTKETSYLLPAWSGWTEGTYTWQIGIIKGVLEGDVKTLIADTGRSSKRAIIKWQELGFSGGGGGSGGS